MFRPEYKPEGFKPLQFRPSGGVVASINPTFRPRDFRIERPLGFRPEEPFIGYLAQVTQTITISQTHAADKLRETNDVISVTDSHQLSYEYNKTVIDTLEPTDYGFALLIRGGIIIGGGGSGSLPDFDDDEDPLGEELDIGLIN